MSNYYMKSAAQICGLVLLFELIIHGVIYSIDPTIVIYHFLLLTLTGSAMIWAGLKTNILLILLLKYKIKLTTRKIEYYKEPCVPMMHAFQNQLKAYENTIMFLEVEK